MTVMEETVLRPLRRSDIPLLAGFAPPEWNIALDSVLLEHCERPYSHALVIASAPGILAVGEGIANGNAGWLGNIVVHPEARNRGLGARLTAALVESLTAGGCRSLALTATPLGEPVYRKLGFRPDGAYVFLRMPRLEPESFPSIRRALEPDLPAVLRLDSFATGESRAALLQPYLPSAWVHTQPDGAIDGYFLPTLGAGPVAAVNPGAGGDLLAFKHAYFHGAAVVPAANQAALRFFLERGAEESSRLQRMALGEELPWRPECIYARGAGYCG
jgi:GNAT superfamily N-acetyltransferase